MKEILLQFFNQYPGTAVLVSLIVSIAVALLGLVPSVFITAANILFFGFWPGVALSFAGEALGAAVAFWGYRKGFKKGVGTRLQQYKTAAALVNAEGQKAFWLILSLRLIPFVPSGLVTFAAAIGQVSVFTFLVASSLGKIPALLLEGYAVLEVTRFGATGKIILGVSALLLLFFAVRQVRSGQAEKA